MTHHTPGPWKTGTGEFSDQIFEQDAEGEDWGHWLICETGGNTANARLIAAAPELKDLLFHALHYVETPGDFTESERLELCEDIETLLARAEGKEPHP